MLLDNKSIFYMNRKYKYNLLKRYPISAYKFSLVINISKQKNCIFRNNDNILNHNVFLNYTTLTESRIKSNIWFKTKKFVWWYVSKHRSFFKQICAEEFLKQRKKVKILNILNLKCEIFSQKRFSLSYRYKNEITVFYIYFKLLCCATNRY